MLTKRPSKMSKTEYKQSLGRLGLTPSGIAKFLNVNPRTSRRWATGQSRINGRTAMLIRLLVEEKEKADRGIDA